MKCANLNVESSDFMKWKGLPFDCEIRSKQQKLDREVIYYYII